MKDNSDSKELGLREQNKRDKLHRIKEASRELFSEKGFENATIRQITKRAGVGIGTIFRYATNKRDLLFLIYNDELDEFPVPTCDDIPGDLPLLDQLVMFFGQLYKFFASQPDLAQDLLREAVFYQSGLQADRFWKSRDSAEKELTLLLERARAAKRFKSKEDGQLLTIMLFSIYRTEVRRWILEFGPDVPAGLELLRPVLRVALTGLATRSGET